MNPVNLRLYWFHPARGLAVSAALAALLFTGRVAADVPTVGIEGTTNVVLAGPLLKAKPVNEKSLIVLRVVDTYPHGTATRYDLRYIGLLPGSFNLADYLVYTDGSPATNLAELTVTVAPLLPEDHSGRLVEDALQSIPLFSRFRELVIAVWIVWALLLIPLMLIHRKRPARAETEPAPRELTVAERLHPLVEKAADGELTPEEQSQLELLLIAYWRHELALDSFSMKASLERLKEHPAAGELLRAMEQWLYKPPGRQTIDVAALLEPYRSLTTSATDTAESTS